VRQLRLRAPDARVATIAIEPVASPHSAEISGAPEADFVVFAERRADDPQDGEGTVWVQQGLKYRLHLPAAATDGARVPLLIWLPDDGTTAEENLSLWRLRLGDEAAVAVLEAPNVETQEDLAPGGRWFGAESFDDDIAAATAGVDRLWSYLVDHAPVDPARVCVAGEGAGATVATAVALYADRVAARAVAIAPRRYAKLRDLPLPLPELRGDDPRPEASLSIVVDDPSGEGR
jgi:poly(3-hydroxybutyrate) depolymerase